MKSKIVVVYHSKTGFTEKYARLAAKETACDLLKLSEATAEKLSGYNAVVFGSRAHAGRIDHCGKMQKLLQKAGIRKSALFVTGATPNEAEKIVEGFWKQNLSERELSEIPHFYLQSGLCYEKMNLTDRLLMKAAAFIIKRKQGKNPEEKAFEQAISHSYDISSEEYLAPLVEWIKKEQAGGEEAPAETGKLKSSRAG